MRILTVVFLLLLAAGPAQHALAAGETMYVTDQFEITMRSGTSTSNSIIRMLPSGEPVTVLESDLASKYSLVQSADDKQGYVITRYLMEQPAAREQLSSLQTRLQQRNETIAAQKTEIAELKQNLQSAQADNQALANTLRASEQELGEVRSAAQDTLNIVEQNKRLQTVVDELRQEKVALVDANAELGDSTRQDWFVRGGAVSLIAFLVGIIVTRIRWRKQDSWGSY